MATMKANKSTSVKVTDAASRTISTIHRQTGIMKQAIVEKGVELYKEHLTTKGLMR